MRTSPVAVAAMLVVLSACSGGSSDSPGPGPVCGNRVVEAGEACDDGNTVGTDGCTAACLVSPGWTCTGTPSVCTTTCGDGALDAGEGCDDANRTAGDGCSASCTVESGWSCTGSPSACVAGCGDGVRAGTEQCDDGNGANLDGCDASCRFEQVLRASQLSLAFAPTATCAQNVFGGAVTNATARQIVNAGITQAVASGQLGFLLWIRGLDDLTGGADAAVDVAVLAGGVHPDVASFDNAAQRDGWFAADGRTVDGGRVPRARLAGAFVSGTLTAGPGHAPLPMTLLAGVTLLELEEARVSFQAAGLSAPAVSLDGQPPGHLLSERLSSALQSFHSAGAGELCGGIVARSLANVPLAQQFVSTCGYPAERSFLDLLVGGCATMSLSAPTQPDRVDPAAPVLGAGGPYRLVFDEGSKAVTGCQDAQGAVVDLDGCLDAAAFSSAFTFAADRVIVRPACGDGSVGSGEGCDDGNALDGDGCTPSCTVENGWTCTGSPSVCTTPCGNGTLDAGEACDDGNRGSGDGCSSACAVEDGFSCSGEPSACAATCGDGVVAASEQCDDGNVQAGDGCDAVCLQERGWSCDGRPSVCTTYCGDGAIAGAEQCDDANDQPGDGCDSICAIEPGWTCVGAPSVCAPICGDGLVHGAEQCDDGNVQGGDGCSPSCIPEPGWSCTGAPSVCTAVCGDGIVVSAAGEACDDGNADPLDGCTPTCTVEQGWTCAGSPSACVSTCGDGVVAVGVEPCDDGNTAPGDGCDPYCGIDLGWSCTGSPSVCVDVCASCDDGVSCTVDTCDAQALACGHAPVDSVCDDLDACNGVETCGARGCEMGTPPTCDDGNPCTADACIPPAGCTHTPFPDDTACDGGVCRSGVCQVI